MNTTMLRSLTAIGAAVVLASAFGQGGPMGPPPGQGPGGPGGPGMGRRQGPPPAPLMILQMNSVRRELNLSQDQIKQLDSLRPGPGRGQGRGPGGPGGQRMGPGGQGGQGMGPGGPGGPAGPGGPGGQGMGPGGQGRGRGMGPGGPGGPGGPDILGPVREILNERQLARLRQLSLQFEGVPSWPRPDVNEKLNLTEDQMDQIHEILQSNPRPRPNGTPEEHFQLMLKARAEALQKGLRVLTAEQKKIWSEMTGKTFENWEQPIRRQQAGQRQAP